MASRARSYTVFGTLAILALAAVAATALPAASQANVIATVSYSPYGLPNQSGPVIGIDLSTAALGTTSAAGITFNSGANAVTLNTYQNGAIVNGSLSNAYAAPVTGGSTDSPTYLTSNYLSSGGSPGYIVLNFVAEQSYLGLLWGSVGAGDTLSFYDTKGITPTAAVAQLTGTQAMSASGFNSANGSRGFNGSEYALINLIGGTYNQVVLGETGGPSFEAAIFQYAAANQTVPVPEPISIVLLAAGLVGIGCVRTAASRVSDRARRPVSVRTL